MIATSNRQLEADPLRRARIPAVDVARGVAILAMVAYHFAWDLSELRLIETDVAGALGWRILARAIASSFLTLVGVSLVLAHGEGIRRRAFARRLATVGGAALLVTAATLFAFPDAFIFFGVLHCIALSSLIALPFARWKARASVAAAIVVWAAPLVLTQPVFDAPLLAFLGLGRRVPLTNDWVPLFPWSGFVFAGIAAARLVRVPKFLPRVPRPASSAPAGPGLVPRLAWIGRHSLVVYILHQPVLYGALSGLVMATGPNPAAEAAPFLRSCRATCGETGEPLPVCEATCACTVEQAKRGGLWAEIIKGDLAAPRRIELNDHARACFAKARNPG